MGMNYMHVKGCGSEKGGITYMLDWLMLCLRSMSCVCCFIMVPWKCVLVGEIHVLMCDTCVHVC